MSFRFPAVPGELIRAVAESRKVNIVSHINADGDCVWSSFAMKKILEKMGKEVYLSNAGPFSPEVYNEQSKFLTHLVPGADLILVLDCSSIERISYLADEINGRNVVVIDHHASGSAQFGNISYIVPESPSTSLLVLQVLKFLPGQSLDKDIAEDIYRGFVTDTGFFQFLHKDSGEFLRAVAELADQGVDIGDAFIELNGHKDFRLLRFVSEIILETKMFFGGKLALGVETRELNDKYGDNLKPADAYYAQMSCVEGLDSIIYLEPKENGSKTKIAFRSIGNSKTDVGKIASELGGGGHFHASGATVDMTIGESEEFLIKRFAEENKT